jgi:hypothetical protein
MASSTLAMNNCDVLSTAHSAELKALRALICSQRLRVGLRLRSQEPATCATFASLRSEAWCASSFPGEGKVCFCTSARSNSKPLVVKRDLLSLRSRQDSFILFELKHLNQVQED